MPYVGILQAAGLAKESTLGTVVAPPTEFLPLIAPDSFSEAIELLISKGIRAQPDEVIKVVQGPASLKGGKIKVELEPENCGNLLCAAFGADTISGPAEVSVYTHTFVRTSVAQLPTYTWWFKKGAKYFQFAGCMLNKLELDVKAKEMVILDTDWVALKYDDTGITETVSYSPYLPFKFDQAVVSVAGSGSLNYESIKVTIDNMVEADNALSGSIYPAKIYSKGFKVTVAMSMFLENATEWAKFLAGTATSLTLTLTSGQNVPSSSAATPFSLVLTIPTIQYNAAPLFIENGIMKIAFTGTAVYNSGSGYTMQAALANSRATAY